MTGLFTGAISAPGNTTKTGKIEFPKPPKVFGRLAVIASTLLLAGCMVTPEPLSETDLALSADAYVAEATADQEAVTGAISMYEAMARALKYNLDHRVELMARELAEARVNVARADMLPSLVAGSHYAARDSKDYSFSETTLGNRSANASYSREPETLTKDIAFSWNILDFGLSYVRAKQAADKAMIAEEQKRKVIISIMEDVRTAYWRAVSADRLLAGFQRLESRVEKALANSRALGNSGYTSPAAALVFQRDLVDIKRRIQRMERELRTARIQLAALMNLPPNQNYSLVIPQRRISHLELKIPAGEMVRLALQHRPEMRELAYRSRIGDLEAEAALLELLPGIQLYKTANFDSNDFLLDNNWISWGAKASWNLIRLFQYPARKQVADAESELNRQRSLAMTMAIMTQVEVARVRYHYLRQSALTAQQYHGIQLRLLDQVRQSADSGSASEQSLIREEMNALESSVQYDIAYADLQNAFATIYASIGVNPWGDYLDTELDVATLATSLRQVWRERGDNGS